MDEGRCVHGLVEAQCAICSGGWKPSRRSPWEEHHGTATEAERNRSDEVRPRLLEALGRLEAEGVENPTLFFAGLCSLVAVERDMERWTTTETSGWGPTSTVRNLARGGSAKTWSLDVVEATLEALGTLLDRGDG